MLRVGAMAAFVVVWSSGAQAEPGIGPDLLGEGGVIARAWASGAGRAVQARVASEGRAGKHEAGPFENLFVEVGPEVSPGDTTRSELAGSVGVGVRVFGVGHRGRDASARAKLALADEALQRAAFSEAVVQRYGDWVEAELQARHLVEHLAELERDLMPLRQAAAAGKLDALTVEGLEVELIRLGLELEAARSSASEALSALSVSLGQPVESLDAVVFAELPTEPPQAVWSEVVIEGHPLLARLDAEAKRERSAAEVIRRVDDPLLTLAATVRRVDEPEGPFVFGGLQAGLTLPLSRSGLAEAQRHSGRAVALGLERDHQVNLLGLELAQRQRRHERWVAELERLRKEAEPRLDARVERTAAAVKAGRATVAELVIARRDRIELHHAEVSLVGRLIASSLMSRFWKSLTAQVTGGMR